MIVWAKAPVITAHGSSQKHPDCLTALEICHTTAPSLRVTEAEHIVKH